MSDRALAILIAIVVVAVMGALGVWQYLGRQQQAPQISKPPVKTVKAQTLVEVNVTQCERNKGRTEITGYIRNVGNVDLHYVTVDAIWKDAVGLPIKTDLVYALTNEKLPPGASKPFHAFTNLPAAKCNAEAVDWW